MNYMNYTNSENLFILNNIMDALMDSINCPLDLVTSLRKNTKNKKFHKLIDEHENRFEHIKRQIVEKANNSNISEEFVNRQLKNIHKFVHVLLESELKTIMSEEINEEFSLSLDKIERLKKALSRERDRVRELEDQLKQANLLDEEAKRKHREAVENEYMTLIPLTPMSSNRSSSIIDMLTRHEKLLENSRKLTETQTTVSYEITKKDIDSTKKDKRTKPTMKKNEVAIITVNKPIQNITSS